ncbi:hypothetical protein ACHAXS_006103 [Conticribra weissflogii]
MDTIADEIDTQLTNNNDETEPLHSIPLDERILDLVRRCPPPSSQSPTPSSTRRHVVRPALLASELGLSIEDATRELCGLLSAVGGGDDGASFEFERVGSRSANSAPNEDVAAKANDNTATMTMVFTFPHDFEARARRNRRKVDFRRRLHSLTIGCIKFLKIVTAFGLIISLAVLIIAGIFLLVAAIVALARGGGSAGGGGGGGGGFRNNHPLMHRLRFLFYQLRQILWFYAIFGGGGSSTNQDPFMREVAGDLALMMSVCCGNPFHPFFWMRVSGMGRRGARLSERLNRGWGRDFPSGGFRSWGINDANARNEFSGIAMTRVRPREDSSRDTLQQKPRLVSITSSSQSETEEQRGLLSIAVEFLFGPSKRDSSEIHLSPSQDLDKWKFKASILISLCIEHNGSICLRDLLPFVDDPPSSIEDCSAISEALKIITYFNGKPVETNDDSQSSGLNARFCFPELMAEIEFDLNSASRQFHTFSTSDYAPPSSSNANSSFTSILYNEAGQDETVHSSGDVPRYLYERPFVLTQLTRRQFGQCIVLGLLNFIGIVWVQNAIMPGGLFYLPLDASSSISSRHWKRSSNSGWVIFSYTFMGLLKLLRFYAVLFFVLPFSRLLVVLIRNVVVTRRNERRSNFCRVEL